MTPEWLTLASGETVEWEGRPRLSAAISSLLVGGALALAGVALPLVVPDLPLAVTIVLVVFGVAVAGSGLLTVVNTRYVVTDRSLAIKRGVLSRQVTSVPLEKVQDSAFRQSVGGTLLGYGTVSFDTAGGDAFAFRRIDDPSTVRRLVDRRRRDGSSLPGTPDQWQAVLAEVRALRAAVDRR